MTHNEVPAAGKQGLSRTLRNSWGVLAAGASLALAASVIGLTQPLVAKHMIDAAGSGIATSVLVALFAAQALLDTTSRYVLAFGGERIVLRLRVGMIEHLLRLRVGGYDEHRIGDLLSRVGTDAAAARHTLVDGVATMVAAVVGVVGAVLMAWLDWALFAIVAGLVVLGLAILAPVLRRPLDHLLADTEGAAPPPPVPWRLRLHAVRHTIRALHVLKTGGWGPAHRYHQDLHPGPGWETFAALGPRTAVLLVRREIVFSQLILRAMAPRALCLPRAFSLGVYLSALGLPAEVVVARERAPTFPRYGFHAWTELHGTVVNDRPEVQIGHSVLQRVSARCLDPQNERTPAS
jgi:hypothetical protein